MKKLIVLLLIMNGMGNLIHADPLKYADTEKYATDRNKSTIWRKENVNQGSITFTFSEPKSIHGYTVVSSGTRGPLAAPTSWKLEGINEDAVKIDNRENIEFNQINQRKKFFLNTDKIKGKYKKFKFTLKNENVSPKKVSVFERLFKGEKNRPNRIELSDIELIFSKTKSTDKMPISLSKIEKN